MQIDVVTHDATAHRSHTKSRQEDPLRPRVGSMNERSRGRGRGEGGSLGRISTPIDSFHEFPIPPIDRQT